MNRPLLLLVGVGLMLGLNFPIGKLAMAAGVAPAVWAAVISLGAGAILAIIIRITETPELRPSPKLQFSLISGFVSYVMPNFLTFLVIPKIGSGLAAIMFALSPVVTALLSLVLRVRPPKSLGLLGIGLGLIGALVIILGHNNNLEFARASWVFVALLIPIFLGVGNVYRTKYWPQGASPLTLASLTNLAAVPFLIAIALLQTPFSFAPLAQIPELILLQLAVSTTMFLMFFRLQHIGGPTYLSQIGYVAAAVGIIIGVTYFHETYPLLVWVGAGIILIGIGFSTWEQVSSS